MLLRIDLPYRFLLGSISLLWLLGVPATQGLEWHITGLSSPLKNNVDSHLAFLIEKQGAPDSHLLSKIEERIYQALRAKGYYQPHRLTITPHKTRSSPVVFNIDIDPGKPVVITDIHVTLKGDCQNDPAYQVLLEKELPQQGELLDHGKFDHFLTQLSQLAAQRGYFDAALLNPELQVFPSKNQAVWQVRFDSGKRYCFGILTLQGSQIDTKLIEALVPFKSSEPYNSDKLLTFSQRLSETLWFSSVMITPQFDMRKDNDCLPLLLVVTPRIKNSVELGGRFSTEQGLGARCNWRKPWINSLGHSIESQLKISKPEQQLNLSYRLPLIKDPLKQYYQFSVEFENKHENDTNSKSMNLKIARYLDPWNTWKPSIILNWQGARFTQGSQAKMTTAALYPSIHIDRLRQRGGLLPKWGDKQTYSLDLSRRDWSSRVNFTRFLFNNIWVRSPKKQHRCLLRYSGGWITTTNFSAVPATLRFFAGGDSNIYGIRGYEHKTISPKDEQDKLTGASKLATASIEYHYSFINNWWFALFMDGGLAAHQFTRGAVKQGAGIGVRWDSPIGPIKLDFARAINDSQQRKLQFYFAFGAEL